MKIIIYDNFRLASHLNFEWNKIVLNNKLDISSSFEWNSIIWNSHLSGKNVKIFTIFNKDGILAIFPLFFKVKTIDKIPIKTLSFLSNLNCPHNDLIINSNYKVLNFILEYLSNYEDYRNWDLLEIPNVLIGGKTEECIFKYIEFSNSKYFVTEGLRSPYLKCDGMTWTDYLNGRNKNIKKNFKRKLNNFEKEKTFKFSFSNEINKIWQAIYRIEKSSWKWNNKTSILDSKIQINFYRYLIQNLSHKLIFATLTFEGFPVTYCLGILHNNSLISLKTSYNKKYNSISPGIVIKLKLLKYCFENKIDLFDFCGEDEPHKMDFTDSRNYHRNFFIFNNKSKSKIIYFIDNYIKLIKKNAEKAIH